MTMLKNHIRELLLLLQKWSNSCFILQKKLSRDILKSNIFLSVPSYYHIKTFQIYLKYDKYVHLSQFEDISYKNILFSNFISDIYIIFKCFKNLWQFISRNFSPTSYQFHVCLKR